jgi:hypothetical protein
MRGMVALAGSAVLLAVGCAGSAVPSDRVKALATSEPTACEQGRFQQDGTAAADYYEFIYLDGINYVARGKHEPVSSGDLGERVASVTCTLSGADIDVREPLRDGDSSFVEAGTPVYEVHGFPVRCRVAAEELGKLRAFVAMTQNDSGLHPVCS